MKKRNIITAIVLLGAVAAIVCAVVYFSGTKEVKPTSNYNLCDSAFNSSAINVDAKLYETDIKGIYYSLSPVKYFKVQNNRIAEIKPSGVFSKKVTVSAYQLPLKISYIKSGKQVFGVGEWKKSKVSSADSYIYAFAVLKNMPTAFESHYSSLLLIDTNDNGLPATKRNFSEALAVNLNGESGGYVFDQRNRTVESSGKLRTDWDLLTLSMVNSEYNGYLPSLTARMYSQSEGDQSYDLRITKNGRTSNIAEKTASEFAAVTAHGVSYVKQGDGKFTAYVKNVKTKKISDEKEFSGDIRKDYLIRGEYALRKNSLQLVSLSDLESFDLKENFKSVYDFEVNGNTLVVTGKENNKDGKDFRVQKIVIFNLQNAEKQVLYANDIMNENSPVFVSAGYLFVQKDNKTLILKLSDALKIISEQ